MKRLLPIVLMALLVGACGGTTPATESPVSESPVAEVTPSPTPEITQTFNTDFSVWNLKDMLPTAWTPSADGVTNTWRVITRDYVAEKTQGEYNFPSNYCRTDQQIMEEALPAADQWLACARVLASQGYGFDADEIVLAIYAAGGSRLSADGRVVPASCAPIAGGSIIKVSAGKNRESSWPGADADGNVEVALTAFETTLFGLPAYGYSFGRPAGNDIARDIEVCTQKGDRILVLMTRASYDVVDPVDGEGIVDLAIALPFEQLETFYGPTPVWTEIANATPALVNQ